MNTEEAKKTIEDAGKTWKDFMEWMFGQTVGVDDNGETIWYKHDVERFIQGKPIID